MQPLLHSSSSLIKHEMRSILWTVKTLCSTKRVYIIMNTYLHQVLASSMKFKKLNFIQFSCIENQWITYAYAIHLMFRSKASHSKASENISFLNLLQRFFYCWVFAKIRKKSGFLKWLIERTFGTSGSMLKKIGRNQLKFIFFTLLSLASKILT